LFGESELASTALVTFDALKASNVSTDPQLALIRLNGNKAEQVAALRRDYTPEMQTDTIPARIVNLHRVRTLPLLAVGLAAFLGTMLLGYTLIVSARSRIRELGVVRALGLSARSTGRVLIWQGVLLALLIGAIGIPAGLVAGTYAWRIRTEDLGVANHMVYGFWIPLLLIAVAVVGIICAWLPARRARKATVATVLRTE
jgi:putative ABC transport system permease protein